MDGPNEGTPGAGQIEALHLNRLFGPPRDTPDDGGPIRRAKRNASLNFGGWSTLARLDSIGPPYEVFKSER